MTRADQIEEAAAAWLAREDRDLSPPEAAQLAAWLAQDTGHRVSYLRLKAAWRRADRLAALKGLAAAPARPRLAVRPLAIAAALSLTVLGAGLAYRFAADSDRAVFATAVGGQESVRLADGTRMELNTNTKVQTRVTETERTVTLMSGEAYFEVVHDARRPFVVYAGKHRIMDLGTKFSVLRKGDDVQVVVKEGRVRVDTLNAPDVTAPVIADGGNVVMTHANSTLAAPRNPQDIEAQLGWRRGMLIFNQETLAEVADQFNRYNARQIVVRGKARNIRIGGSFRAGNVESFVGLLHNGFGLTVEDKGNQIFISG